MVNLCLVVSHFLYLNWWGFGLLLLNYTAFKQLKIYLFSSLLMKGVVLFIERKSTPYYACSHLDVDKIGCCNKTYNFSV